MVLTSKAVLWSEDGSLIASKITRGIKQAIYFMIGKRAFREPLKSDWVVNTNDWDSDHSGKDIVATDRELKWCWDRSAALQLHVGGLPKISLMSREEAHLACSCRAIDQTGGQDIPWQIVG